MSKKIKRNEALDYLKRIGRKIQRQRKMMNQSPQQTALAVGIELCHYQQWEQGDSLHFEVGELFRICEHLNVDFHKVI